jgi:hypothetical protein
MLPMPTPIPNWKLGTHFVRRVRLVDEYEIAESISILADCNFPSACNLCRRVRTVRTLQYAWAFCYNCIYYSPFIPLDIRSVYGRNGMRAVASLVWTKGNQDGQTLRDNIYRDWALGFCEAI